MSDIDYSEQADYLRYKKVALYAMLIPTLFLSGIYGVTRIPNFSAQAEQLSRDFPHGVQIVYGVLYGMTNKIEINAGQLDIIDDHDQ